MQNILCWHHCIMYTGGGRSGASLILKVSEQEEGSGQMEQLSRCEMVERCGIQGIPRQFTTSASLPLEAVASPYLMGEPCPEHIQKNLEELITQCLILLASPPCCLSHVQESRARKPNSIPYLFRPVVGRGTAANSSIVPYHILW